MIVDLYIFIIFVFSKEPVCFLTVVKFTKQKQFSNKSDALYTRENNPRTGQAQGLIVGTLPGREGYETRASLQSVMRGNQGNGG